MTKKKIEVVAGIIQNTDGEILCALRLETMSLPNVWEFPGGKLESNESPQEALVREIREELNCTIECEAQVFDRNAHEYEKVIVDLICIKAKVVEGVPKPAEHAELKWLPISNLSTLVWAPADISAVDKLSGEGNSHV
jgi:8-oxo-dGTP diphosphatase